MVLEHYDDLSDSRSSGAPGLTWVDMQNYRDPPPYPGHSKQVFNNQPGFRQSFSGSETSTDVSLSSSENLATSQRQEPQGEENQSSLCNLDIPGQDSSYSILARLATSVLETSASGKMEESVLTSTTTTASSFQNPMYHDLLKQHYHSQQHGMNNFKNSFSSSSELPASTVSFSSSSIYSQGHLTVPSRHGTNRSVPSGNVSKANPNELRIDSLLSNSGNSRIAELSYPSSSSIISGNRVLDMPGYLPPKKDSLVGAGEKSAIGSGEKLADRPYLSTSSSSYPFLSPRVPPVSTFHHPHPYVNTNFTIGSEDSSSSSTSLTSITRIPALTSASCSTPLYTSPASCHTSSSGVSHYGTNLPPPPKYPGLKPTTSSGMSDKNSDIRTCRSYEMMDKVEVQRSNPDLRQCASTPGIYYHERQSPKSANGSCDESDASFSAKAVQMVNLLTEENRQLREELSYAGSKVNKLQQFELEIQKVHESHEAILKSSEKREVLWQAMKRKLEERIQHLESTRTGQILSGMSGNQLENELRRKVAEQDDTISKLLTQKQELSLSKDMLECENAQLRLAAQENKARVDILDSALLNTQSRVLALEEDLRKKQAYKEKMETLEDALHTLQTSSDRQAEKEKEIRLRLQKELDAYKTQGPSTRKAEEKEDMKSVGMLKKMLDEKDAKYLNLESEYAALEQKYVKETTLHHLNRGDPPHPPKEVRLAALEKSSADMERLIEEAKTEKLKHMEELHQSHLKNTELEAKVKQLQTQVVEKEAMVKVFHTSQLSLVRSASHHALCHHSPRPSLISTHSCWNTNQALDLPTTSTSGYREFPTIRHMKTGSASAVELGRKMSMEEDLLTKVQNLNLEQSKSDPDEEVKLWHV